MAPACRTRSLLAQPDRSDGKIQRYSRLSVIPDVCRLSRYAKRDASADAEIVWVEFLGFTLASGSFEQRCDTTMQSRPLCDSPTRTLARTYTRTQEVTRGQQEVTRCAARDAGSWAAGAATWERDGREELIGWRVGRDDPFTRDFWSFGVSKRSRVGFFLSA